MRRALVLAVLVAGCIEVPEPPGQECATNRDCDAGEVCSSGLCYGNPPAGLFAASVSAPSIEGNVVGTEIANFVLPDDGDLGAIQLEAPVTISGRVEAYCSTDNQTCSTLSVGAQIRLTRPSRIPGAPALRFSVESKADVPRGTDSFSIRVPRTLPSDPPWTMTIDPEGGGDAPATDGGTDPAELVPPRRLALYAADDIEHQTYTLGGADPIVITGTLRDAFATPLTNYRVVALGRWDADSNLTKVSTVDFTADGTYSITLADHVMGPLEIVARPFGENDVSPSLRLRGVPVASGHRNLTQPTGLGQRRAIDIPVEALAGNGEVRSVSGVRVIVTATVESTVAENLRAEFRAEATTDELGIAHLAVLDGAALASTYLVRLIPPASSTYGVLHRSALELPTETSALAQTLPAVRLPSRVALRGTLVDVRGAPLAAVSVTARRSQRFLWSVPMLDQQYLDEVPAATALTTDSGEFVVWVDPAIADVWGNYDLLFEAPAGSPAPNWWIADVPLPRVSNPGTVSLDTVVIPDAARLHATIVNSSGQAVQGSDLRVFQISSNDTVCMEVAYAPDTCPPVTVVLGHGQSDAKGKLTLTLPRP